MNPFAKETGVALVHIVRLQRDVCREWDADSERMKTDEVAKRKYDSTEETDRKIIEEVGKIAEKHGAARAQIATAWLWKKGVVAQL